MAKVGRPTSYKKEFCERIIKFFQAESHIVAVDETFYKASDDQVSREYDLVETWAKNPEDLNIEWSPKARTHKVIANRYPTMERFADMIWVHVDTLIARAHDKHPDDYEDESKRWQYIHPEFRLAYMRAKQLQKAILIENWLQGVYTSNFAIFVAKNNHDMKDQTDHTLQGAKDWEPVKNELRIIIDED